MDNDFSHEKHGSDTPTEPAAPGDSSPGAASFQREWRSCYQPDSAFAQTWDRALAGLGRIARLLGVPAVVTLAWAQILNTTSPLLALVFCVTLAVWSIVIGGTRHAE